MEAIKSEQGKRKVIGDESVEKRNVEKIQSTLEDFQPKLSTGLLFLKTNAIKQNSLFSRRKLVVQILF
jgi:hypothetical protein